MGSTTTAAHRRHHTPQSSAGRRPQRCRSTAASLPRLALRLDERRGQWQMSGTLPGPSGIPWSTLHGSRAGAGARRASCCLQALTVAAALRSTLLSPRSSISVLLRRCVCAHGFVRRNYETPGEDPYLSGEFAASGSAPSRSPLSTLVISRPQPAVNISMPTRWNQRRRRAWLGLAMTSTLM
jgi:hypothetical protein